MHVFRKAGPRMGILLCFFLTASLWWNQRLYLRGVSSVFSASPIKQNAIINGTTTMTAMTSRTETWDKYTAALTSAVVLSGHNDTEQIPATASPDESNKIAFHSPVTSNNDTTLPSSQNITTFHRWNSAQGIDMMALWQYIQIYLVANESDKYDRYGPVPAYIFSNADLQISNKVYRRRCENNHGRYLYVGPFLQETLHYYYYNMSHKETQYPFLTRALREGGLPLILNLEDYVGCNRQNYNFTRHGELNSTLANIPMLTLSSSPSCDFAFPIPSYTTLQLAKEEANEWDAIFHKQDLEYPWNTKLQKAIWRGMPSDGWKKKTSMLDRPRVYFNYVAKNHTDILDVAMGCLPPCRISKPVLPFVTLAGYIPMADFQKYRAVLDIDGGSWSERFPRLLCQNSVVIKLNPEQIDYFWPTVQAGVHFLAADLSNFVEVARYATSDDNQEEMQKIVSNANKWCRQRMVIHQIRLDILSILEGYSQELYRGDTNWRRHISKLFKLKLTYPFPWTEHPVSRWNTT